MSGYSRLSPNGQDALADAIGLAKLAWESPWRARRHLLRIILTPAIYGRLRMVGVQIGPGARFFGAPLVHRYRRSSIALGANVELRSSRDSNVLGLAHPVILTTMAADARIEIGDHVGLSGTTVCALKYVRIGSGTLIGADVIVTDNDHHRPFEDRLMHSRGVIPAVPVIIGENVFVGARAIILKGSTIGDGAVIGAGAVVSGEIPPKAVAVGNPARIVDRLPIGAGAAQSSP